MRIGRRWQWGLFGILSVAIGSALAQTWTPLAGGADLPGWTRSRIAATVAPWVVDAPRAIFCIGTYGGAAYNRVFTITGYEAYAGYGLIYTGGQGAGTVIFPSMAGAPTYQSSDGGYCLAQSINAYCASGNCFK